MGFLGAIGSAICSGISAACSFVSSCIDKVGSVIGGMAGKLLAPMFPQIEVALRIISAIVQIVSFVSEALGLTEKDEKVDELGAKAVQEDTLPREEFKTEQEYIKYLREEIKLDREKFEKFLPTERLACSAIGVSILSKGIEEKTGVEIPPEFLLSAEKIKMSAEMVKECIEKFKEGGFTTLGVISDYLQAKSVGGKETKISEALIESYKAVNPEMSCEGIEEKLVEWIATSQESGV